jgi:hypothetical protein
LRKFHSIFSSRFVAPLSAPPSLPGTLTTLLLLMAILSCMLFLLQPPDKQQLSKEGVILDDARKLCDLKVENDDVIAMCYQLDGKWGISWSC